MVIDIRVDTKNVMRMLDGYTRTIPTGARRGAWLVALKMQGELRKEIQLQKLIWRGKLLEQTRARKISKNVYGVFMPFYGKDLDERKPHFERTKGKLLQQWVKDKFGTKRITGLSKVNKKTGIGKVYVTRHPFIDKPFLKVSKKAKKIVQREINRAIRRKGK